MKLTPLPLTLLRFYIIPFCWLCLTTTLFAKNIESVNRLNPLVTYSWSEQLSNSPTSRLFSTITITATVVDATCSDRSDGSISVMPIGGIPPLTYSWSNGSTTQNINNLPAGIYQLTITDSGSCVDSFSITIGAPPVLTAEVLTANSLTCNGDNSGSIPLTVTGGTSPYSFDWDFAPDVQNPDGLAAGEYNVLVTDSYGCTVFASATVTEPTEMILSDTSSALCSTAADGEIDLSVSGGIPPYDYNWTNGSTTEDVNNLSAGTYDVTVSDSNGCTELLSITVAAPEPVELSISDLSDFEGVNVSCSNSSDGFASVQVTGGVEPFSYQWSNGDTIANTQNLAAGNYTVTATDANGCTDEEVINMEAPDPISIVTETLGITCFGDSNGAILIDSVGGGAVPFMYALDGGDFIQDRWFANLMSGSYQLMVQDANGCEEEFTQIVEGVPELQVFIEGDTIIRLGEQSGISVLLNIPATSTLQQSTWSKGSYWEPDADGSVCDSCMTQTIRPLETTTYEYLVVDQDGCIGRDELKVQVLKDRAVYIPNAFSPNGDGKNDKLTVFPGPEVSTVNFFKIYNRWGVEVYQQNSFVTTESEEGWDGRFKGQLMDAGVYVYQAQVVFWDGRVELLKGDVTLFK